MQCWLGIKTAHSYTKEIFLYNAFDRFVRLGNYQQNTLNSNVQHQLAEDIKGFCVLTT